MLSKTFAIALVLAALCVGCTAADGYKTLWESPVTIPDYSVFLYAKGGVVVLKEGDPALWDYTLNGIDRRTGADIGQLLSYTSNLSPNHLKLVSALATKERFVGVGFTYSKHWPPATFLWGWSAKDGSLAYNVSTQFTAMTAYDDVRDIVVLATVGRTNVIPYNASNGDQLPTIHTGASSIDQMAATDGAVIVQKIDGNSTWIGVNAITNRTWHFKTQSCNLPASSGFSGYGKFVVCDGDKLVAFNAHGHKLAAITPDANCTGGSIDFFAKGIFVMHDFGTACAYSTSGKLLWSQQGRWTGYAADAETFFAIHSPDGMTSTITGYNAASGVESFSAVTTERLSIPPFLDGEDSSIWYLTTANHKLRAVQFN